MSSIALPDVTSAQRHRFLRHALLNLPRVDASGDVASLSGWCQRVPAIVAAAGPSLNRNLEELKTLRAADGDGALLLCVDMALATCLADGLVPHFTVASDLRSGVSHFRNLPPCQETWLVAEPGSDPDGFASFEGRTLVFRSADHDLQPWPWLRSHGVDRGVLRGGATVITAVDFARLLGCDPIVLIGADFAYTSGQPFCRGTVHERAWSEAIARGRSLEDIWQACLSAPGCDVTDLNGQRIRTTAPLIALRDELIALSLQHPAHRFANATGAGILSGGTFSTTSLQRVLPKGVPPVHPARTIDEIRPCDTWDDHTLARHADALQRWQAERQVDPELDLGELVDEAIERWHHERLTAGAAAASAGSVSATDFLAFLETATPDAPTTTTIVARLAEGAWREWSLAERVRVVRNVTRIYRATRSIHAITVHPLLAEVFRSTLMPELHPGLAAHLYDDLSIIRWMTAEDPQRIVSLREEATAPFTSHARQWATAQRLAPRRTIGVPPYRIAYLSQGSDFGVNDAVTALHWSILKGHTTLGSERFRFSCYAWNGISDRYRSEIEALGVTVKGIDVNRRPGVGLTRLRRAIAADGIDALITLLPTGIPGALFATRAAPVQLLLDLAFPAWLGDAVDYTMLCFPADPRLLNLSSQAHERIDYRFDERFVCPSVDAAAVAAQRARFRGARHVFGFVGRLVKLSPDYFRALRAMLERVPDAAVYLGGVGDGDAIREALSTFGDIADRVVVDTHLVDGPVLVHAIDTFLDTFPFMGGLSCLQAQAAGRPVIYMTDKRPGYARFLGMARDKALEATTVDDYAALAARLAQDEAFYATRAREAERVAIRMTHVAATAASIEDALDRLIQRTRDRE
jgi:hypothetical protein